MTNKEWLDYLAQNAPHALSAWFDAEHVERQERALDGDTEPENADSRELILTDLEKKTREWHDYDGNYMRIYSYVAYAQMKELLDRQSAITAEETSNAWEEYRDATQREIAELTAERGELNRQINTMREVIREFRNERDHYRSKFGKCLDYADAIHALMDDEDVA